MVVPSQSRLIYLFQFPNPGERVVGMAKFSYPTYLHLIFVFKVFFFKFYFIFVLKLIYSIKNIKYYEFL